MAGSWGLISVAIVHLRVHRKDMQPYDRQILSTFFTYTDNYCLRAEVQRFQLQSARAVEELYQAAQDASAELGSIKRYSVEIDQHVYVRWLDVVHRFLSLVSRGHDEAYVAVVEWMGMRV